MIGNIYSFEDNTLIVVDNDLSIHIQEPFAPIRLPEDIKDGMPLNEGYSIVAKYDTIEDTEHLSKAYVSKDNVPCGQYRTYHHTGAIKSEHFYKKDAAGIAILHGPSTYYSERGSVLTKAWYYRGKHHGVTFTYYPSKALYAKLSYKEGSPELNHTYYYEDGTIKTVLPYKGGKLHGLSTLYHEKGSTFRTIPYNQGNKDGIEQEFNPNGVLVTEKEYNNNALIRETYRNARNVLMEERIHHTKEKSDIRKWDQFGHLHVERVFIDSKNYTYKEWDENKAFTKEYHGFFDGEKMCIEKYIKGSITEIERKMFTQELTDKIDKALETEESPCETPTPA
jgi:antitoxin component YwqK of YwqJK toxin-antitoxin module